MGARKYSTFFLLLTIFVITAAEDTTDQNAETRLSVLKPEHNQDVIGKDILSTLQELYHSLVGQIATLEAKQTSSLTEKEMSETSHLVQHYTAQKNNVEREISLIQSIGAAPPSDTAPRHILAHISQEEKSVPSLLNIFKKPKPSNGMSDFPYNFPYPAYPSYYPGYGPQYPYPYQAVPPPKPDYPYMNTLIQSTFPGHETGPNGNQQTFTVRNQPQPAVGNTNLQVPPPPQVTLQGEVSPAQVELQRVPGAYPPQPQIESTFKPQVAEVAQSAQALNPTNQQSGQGVFIYYPNAVITEDEEQERPSIVDRVGQAFDRFGQAITNLATRQTLRSTPNGHEGIVANRHENAPTRIRVVHNRPRSSPSEKIPMARMLNAKKPKLRWVSV